MAAEGAVDDPPCAAPAGEEALEGLAAGEKAQIVEPEPFDNIFKEAWSDSDFVITVENENFHVHSNILKISSPQLGELIDAEKVKEGAEKKIELQNRKKKSVYEMLKLIYPIDYIINERSEFDDLLILSRDYKIDRLRLWLDQYLSEYVRKSKLLVTKPPGGHKVELKETKNFNAIDYGHNIVRILKLSDEFSLLDLRTESFEIISSCKAPACFQSVFYKTLCDTTKRELVIQKVKKLANNIPEDPTINIIGHSVK